MPCAKVAAADREKGVDRNHNPRKKEARLSRGLGLFAQRFLGCRMGRAGQGQSDNAEPVRLFPLWDYEFRRAGRAFLDWRSPSRQIKLKGSGVGFLPEPSLADCVLVPSSRVALQHSASAYHVPLIRTGTAGRSPH
jgi:hypothetical protein